MARTVIQFNDYIQFDTELTDKARKDFLPGQSQLPSVTSTNNSLRIKVAATHAGKVTRNNAIYLPHLMQDSTHTWVNPYKKPILLHHKDHEDAVGRVAAANYIDLSPSFKDNYYSNKKINEIKDSLQLVDHKTFDAFVKGELSISDAIDVVNEMIVNDESLNTDLYEGLGFIELTIDVHDPEAIKKVLDKRYFTGSIGASTNQALCSICKTDWAGEDGPCEHKPGKEYEGKKCVMVAGKFVYDEWSFVNRPADTGSSVIGDSFQQHKVEVKKGETVTDFFNMVIFNGAGKIPEVRAILDSVSNTEGTTVMQLTIQEAIKLVKQSEPELEDFAVAQIAEQILLDFSPDENQNVEEQFMAALKAFFERKEDAAKTEDATQDTAEDAVKAFFGDSYEDILGEDEAEGRAYAESLFGVVEDAKTEEEKAELTELVLDAKLSSKKRKSLPSSTFCGPNRSFPVNDCAHYTAALRLLNRYKGPGDKSRIRACIMRKGRRMGCVKKEDAVTEVGQFTAEWFDHYSTEELLQIRAGAVLALQERGVGVEDQTTVIATETKEELEALRVENSQLKTEIEQLEDSLLSSTESLKDEKIQRVIALKCLAKEPAGDGSVEDFAKDLRFSDVEDCEALLKDYTAKVDINGIQNTIKDGLAKQPQGTVDNPLGTQDNSVKSKRLELTKGTIRELQDAHARLVKIRGQQYADWWLRTAIDQHYSAATETKTEIKDKTKDETE